MPRSAEQAIRDAMVGDLLFWFRFGEGKLLKDDKCAKNIGKLLALEGYCAKLEAMREREREMQRNKETP